ncbi:MAG TPA: helix-turn-helix domain-containing protein [Prolixibacteraceae bacterium]|jgi:hypothetical protein
MKDQQPHATSLSEFDKDNNSHSQSEQIKSFLLSGESLTALDALRMFQCWSLTQRVFDLRMKGLPIITEMVTTGSGKRIAKYYLNPKNDERANS